MVNGNTLPLIGVGLTCLAVGFVAGYRLAMANTQALLDELAGRLNQ